MARRRAPADPAQDALIPAPRPEHRSAPSRDDVARPTRRWEPEDQATAYRLWQKLGPLARRFLLVLAERPGRVHFASEIVPAARLPQQVEEAHSVLGWAGKLCGQGDRTQIWETDESRSPRPYWMTHTQATLVLNAHTEELPQTSFLDNEDVYRGRLDYLAEVCARTDQTDLRQRLLGAKTIATCDLCQQDFPRALLVAAHIKRRSECTETERRCRNIAMLACLFGCDKLYEDGYLCVDESGEIQVRDCPPGPVFDRVQSLRGRKCSAHRPKNAAYFAWHRENVFSAV
jgi:hypothetical protein